MARNIQAQAQRRLQTERGKIPIEGAEIGYFACPKSIDDFLTWYVFIRGNKDSIYDGIIFHTEMSFPSDYPMNPPQMKFITKMIHPNIYKDGSVCISILHRAGDDPTAYEKPDERWSPVQSIRTIVLSVMTILNEPNPESPADVDASKKFIENKDMFYEEARKYAMDNGIKIYQIEELCKDIFVEGEKEVMLKCLRGR